MGNLILAAASTPAKKSGSPLLFIVFLAAIGGIYFFVLMPRRKRMMAAQQAANGSSVRVDPKRTVLEPGQRVRTSAGIFGTLTIVEDNQVELEIAPGVEVTMLRQAIVAIIPDDEPVEDYVPGDAEDGDEAGHEAHGEVGDETSAEDDAPVQDGESEPHAGDRPADDLKDHTP